MMAAPLVRDRAARGAGQVASRFLRLPQTYLVVGLTAGIAHLTLAKDLYRWQDRFLACILLVILLIAIHGTMVSGARRFPLLTFVLLQAYVMYGLPQFTQEGMQLLGGWYVPPQAAVTGAMTLVVGAVMGAVGAFLAAQRLASLQGFNFAALFPRPDRRWRVPLLLFSMACLVQSFLENTRPDLVPLVVRNVFACVFSPALALCLVLHHGLRYNDQLFRRLGVGMAAIMMAFGLLSSMLESIVLPMYLVVASHWVWRRQLRLRWACLAFAAFALLNPVKGAYRSWVSEMPAVSSAEDAVDRLAEWGRRTSEFWHSPSAAVASTTTMASRTSGLVPLAQVVDWVPSVVPHNRGEGLGTAFLFFIPRVVWRNKPGGTDLINNRYAVTFRYTTRAGVERTTFGIWQPADGYWDFGIAGALGYLALTGFALGFLFSRHTMQEDVGNILCIALSASFFQVFGPFYGFVASLFSLFSGAWIALATIALTGQSLFAGPFGRDGGSAVLRAQGTPGATTFGVGVAPRPRVP